MHAYRLISLPGGQTQEAEHWIYPVVPKKRAPPPPPPPPSPAPSSATIYNASTHDAIRVTSYQHNIARASSQDGVWYQRLSQSNSISVTTVHAEIFQGGQSILGEKLSMMGGRGGGGGTENPPTPTTSPHDHAWV